MRVTTGAGLKLKIVKKETPSESPAPSLPHTPQKEEESSDFEDHPDIGILCLTSYS